MGACMCRRRGCLSRGRWRTALSTRRFSAHTMLKAKKEIEGA